MEIVEYLFEKGVSLTEGWDPYSRRRMKVKRKMPAIQPLFFALKNKNIRLEILKYFFQKLELAPKSLHLEKYCEYRRNISKEIVEFFFEKENMSISINTYYPISESSNTTVELMEIFLKNGLNTNYFNPFDEDLCLSEEDDFGFYTPFETACFNVLDPRVAQKMIEYGADLNLKVEKKTVFERIVENYLREINDHIISIFISILSTNLVLPDALQRSIKSTSEENKQLCSLLVEYRDGFIWNKENHQNFPPFFRSQTESFLKCIYFLIKNKRFQQTFPKPILFIIIKHFSIFPDPQINKKVK